MIHLFPYFRFASMSDGIRHHLAMTTMAEVVAGDTDLSMELFKTYHTDLRLITLEPDLASYLGLEGEQARTGSTSFPITQYRDNILMRARQGRVSRKEDKHHEPLPRPRSSTARKYREIAAALPPTLYMSFTLQVCTESMDEPIALQVLAVNTRALHEHRFTTLFHVECSDFTTMPEDYYQADGTLLKGCHEWAMCVGDRKRYNVPDPVILGTFKALSSNAFPHAKHEVFIASLPHLRKINQYTREMFFRWSTYGDPNAPLPRGPVRLPPPPEGITLAELKKSNLSAYRDYLVMTYLRPWMNDIEYELLENLVGGTSVRTSIAHRAKRLRKQLYAKGVKDVTQFPLYQYTIKFRREFFKATGISLHMSNPPMMPADAKSILSLDVTSPQELSYVS
jgi:hypothetical protein